MGRLFAGTPWDCPPTCDRCGRLESDCACPPVEAAPVRPAPKSRTARLRLESRSKGKMVTVVRNLDPAGNDLPALAARLKARCGSGGTVKEGLIELQGDHLNAVESVLTALGYRTSRG